MFLSASFVSITLAMRHGEVAVVAPFRYAILLWAVVMQIAIFGVWPDISDVDRQRPSRRDRPLHALSRAQGEGRERRDACACLNHRRAAADLDHAIRQASGRFSRTRREAETSFAGTLRGITAMVAAQLVFLLNDSLNKLASERLPMGEIIFIRGAVRHAPRQLYRGCARPASAASAASAPARCRARDRRARRNLLLPRRALSHADRQRHDHLSGGAAHGNRGRRAILRRDGRLAPMDSGRCRVPWRRDCRSARAVRLRRIRRSGARLCALRCVPRSRDPRHAVRHSDAAA